MTLVKKHQSSLYLPPEYRTALKLKAVGIGVRVNDIILSLVASYLDGTGPATPTALPLRHAAKHAALDRILDGGGHTAKALAALLECDEDVAPTGGLGSQPGLRPEKQKTA